MVATIKMLSSQSCIVLSQMMHQLTLGQKAVSEDVQNSLELTP